ncbi:hypothetical protein DRN98_06860 [Methanosarcinales archaeon]|nr:MAG: hypothetical protein DRN98_06860 [Methanosarcinales archaeon]
MSIFTGLFPIVHGVQNFKRNGTYVTLDNRIHTLAEILRKEGYITIGLHNGGNVSETLGFDKGFILYTTFFWRHKRKQKELSSIIKLIKYTQKPMFLFLHTYICHSPYVKAPKAIRDKFLEKPVPGLPVCLNDIGGSLRNFRSANNKFWKNIHLRNPLHRKHVISLYDAGIYYADQAVGQVIKILKDNQMYNNSFIIILSDHGEEFYEHGGKGHNKLFIECLHVPLIIKFPYNKYAGMKIRTPVRTIDLMATLFDILNIRTNTSQQGISFFPLLKKNKGYSPIFKSYARKSIGLYKDHYFYSNQEINRCKEWLFDMDVDPKQTHNLTSKKPLLLEEMRKYASKIMQNDIETKKEIYQETLHRIRDKHLLQQLKALGYIN